MLLEDEHQMIRIDREHSIHKVGDIIGCPFFYTSLDARPCALAGYNRLLL